MVCIQVKNQAFYWRYFTLNPCWSLSVITLHLHEFVFCTYVSFVDGAFAHACHHTINLYIAWRSVTKSVTQGLAPWPSWIEIPLRSNTYGYIWRCWSASCPICYQWTNPSIIVRLHDQGASNNIWAIFNHCQPIFMVERRWQLHYINITLQRCTNISRDLKGLRGGWVRLKKYFHRKDYKNRMYNWMIPWSVNGISIYTGDRPPREGEK